jgi:hypothetical protein
MTEEDFKKITGQTEQTRDKYSKNTGLKLIDNRVESINKYPYRTTKLEPPPLPPITFGFTDRYFGGQVNKIAKIRNSPWHILADKNDNTLALYIPKRYISELTHPELKSICTRFKIKYEPKATKAELVEILEAKFS